jgi:hypothetical protein
VVSISITNSSTVLTHTPLACIWSEGIAKTPIDLGSPDANKRIVYAPHIYGPGAPPLHASEALRSVIIRGNRTISGM